MLFDLGRGGGCCFRVVVTRTQLIRLVYERNQGRTISMCAMKAGMSRKTAGKYLSQENVLDVRRVPHDWKTRKDPIEQIWPRAQEMLQNAPELEAKALFEHLMPGGAGAERVHAIAAGGLESDAGASGTGASGVAFGSFFERDSSVETR